MPIDNRDLKSEGLSRLITIYKNSPNMKNFLTPFLGQMNDIETTFQDILKIIDIDEASGDDLDVLGLLLGVHRPTTPKDVVQAVFVFSGAAGEKPGIFTNEAGWSDGTINSGGSWLDIRSLFFDVVPMPDSGYRRILKAKVRMNWFNGSVDGVISAIDEILDGSTATITLDESTPLNPVFTIDREFTLWELYIFSGSYVGGQVAIPSQYQSRTIFNSFIYPKTLGVWYTITDTA